MGFFRVFLERVCRHGVLLLVHYRHGVLGCACASLLLDRHDVRGGLPGVGWARPIRELKRFYNMPCVCGLVRGCCAVLWCAGAAVEWACLLNLALMCIHWSPEVLSTAAGREVGWWGGCGFGGCRMLFGGCCSLCLSYPACNGRRETGCDGLLRLACRALLSVLCVL